mgnify:CR=1 FL=1
MPLAKGDYLSKLNADSLLTEFWEIKEITPSMFIMPKIDWESIHPEARELLRPLFDDIYQVVLLKKVR